MVVKGVLKKKEFILRLAIYARKTGKKNTEFPDMFMNDIGQESEEIDPSFVKWSTRFYECDMWWIVLLV